MTMDARKGYIVLTHETGYKHPVQARIKKMFHGKIEIFHFFAEWDTFEEAIDWLMHAHSHYEIIVDPQCKNSLIS